LYLNNEILADGQPGYNFEINLEKKEWEDEFFEKI